MPKSNGEPQCPKCENEQLGAALRQHLAAFDAEVREGFETGHLAPFDTCPHPECTEGRAILGELARYFPTDAGLSRRH